MRDVDQADTKILLLEHIEKTPGIRYRELLRLTGHQWRSKLSPDSA